MQATELLRVEVVQGLDHQLAPPKFEHLLLPILAVSFGGRLAVSCGGRFLPGPARLRVLGWRRWRLALRWLLGGLPEVLRPTFLEVGGDQPADLLDCVEVLGLPGSLLELCLRRKKQAAVGLSPAARAPRRNSSDLSAAPAHRRGARAGLAALLETLV